MADGNRFEAFSESERVLLMMGLTLDIMDMMYGIVSDEPASPVVAREKMPIMIRMVNEMADTFGTDAVNRDLVAQLMAVLDQRAAEARDAG
jgi:hypothetical protein